MLNQNNRPLTECCGAFDSDSGCCPFTKNNDDGTDKSKQAHKLRLLRKIRDRAQELNQHKTKG